MAKKAVSKPATKKRPTDVNQLAHFLAKQVTEPQEQTAGPSKDEISSVMAALGRRGGKVGGKARAESMSRDRRKEIAAAGGCDVMNKSLQSVQSIAVRSPNRFGASFVATICSLKSNSVVR